MQKNITHATPIVHRGIFFTFFFYDYYITTVGFYELRYLCRAMNKLKQRELDQQGKKNLKRNEIYIKLDSCGLPRELYTN